MTRVLLLFSCVRYFFAIVKVDGILCRNGIHKVNFAHWMCSVEYGVMWADVTCYRLLDSRGQNCRSLSSLGLQKAQRVSYIWVWLLVAPIMMKLKHYWQKVISGYDWYLNQCNSYWLLSLLHSLYLHRQRRYWRNGYLASTGVSFQASWADRYQGHHYSPTNPFVKPFPSKVMSADCMEVVTAMHNAMRAFSWWRTAIRLSCNLTRCTVLGVTWIDRSMFLVTFPMCRVGLCIHTCLHISR